MTKKTALINLIVILSFIFNTQLAHAKSGGVSDDEKRMIQEIESNPHFSEQEKKPR